MRAVQVMISDQPTVRTVTGTDHLTVTGIQHGTMAGSLLMQSLVKRWHVASSNCEETLKHIVFSNERYR